MRYIRWLVPIRFAFGLVPLAAAQNDQRCFPETNQCTSGRICQFWEQNGGLPVFGFPTGPQQEITFEGKPYQAQEFERNRLELHPAGSSKVRLCDFVEEVFHGVQTFMETLYDLLRQATDQQGSLPLS